VKLQDRGGHEFLDGDQGLPAAFTYLAESNALLYFFDPVYDHPWRAQKHHSFDFFAHVEAYLGWMASTHGTLLGQFLPHHIAVCIPKLDEQEVFNSARNYGFLNTDAAGLPWVPEELAESFFERLCRDQYSEQADYLLASLRRSFHPSRISYHVISSIGYWMPDGGLDPADVRNVVEVAPTPGGPGHLVRGEASPLHILDPLIRLAKRLERGR
jgi:hypothetical protein